MHLTDTAKIRKIGLVVNKILEFQNRTIWLAECVLFCPKLSFVGETNDAICILIIRGMFGHKFHGEKGSFWAEKLLNLEIAISREPMVRFFWYVQRVTFPWSLNDGLTNFEQTWNLVRFPPSILKSQYLVNQWFNLLIFAASYISVIEKWWMDQFWPKFKVGLIYPLSLPIRSLDFEIHPKCGP